MISDYPFPYRISDPEYNEPVDAEEMWEKMSQAFETTLP